MARTHVVLSDEVIAGINNEWVSEAAAGCWRRRPGRSWSASTSRSRSAMERAF